MMIDFVCHNFVECYELLHKVAFREKLGRSLYCPAYNLYHISALQVSHANCY